MLFEMNRQQTYERLSFKVGWMRGTFVCDDFLSSYVNSIVYSHFDLFVLKWPYVKLKLFFKQVEWHDVIQDLVFNTQHEWL